MSSERQAPSRKGASGLVFVGCLLIGLVTGNVAAYLVGGLGAGFAAMAIVRIATGEW